LPIEAVVREVGRPADEPFRVWRIPFQHLVPALEPMQLSGRIAPEFFGVIDRLAINPPILVERFNLRLRRELLRRREEAILLKIRIDRRTGWRTSLCIGHESELPADALVEAG